MLDLKNLGLPPMRNSSFESTSTCSYKFASFCWIGASGDMSTWEQLCLFSIDVFYLRVLFFYIYYSEGTGYEPVATSTRDTNTTTLTTATLFELINLQIQLLTLIFCSLTFAGEEQRTLEWF